MGSRPGFFATLGLLLAGLGIITPIIWDYYKTKSAIELHLLSTLALLDTTNKLNPEKLIITYDKKGVQNISKMQFRLTNIGAIPLRASDLEDPPTLIFPDDTQVLEFQKDRVAPENLEFTHTIDQTKRKLTIGFRLLNPGDLIQFSVLLDGKPELKDARARIAGVKELAFVDKRTELSKERKPISWTVYTVSIFSVLIAFIIIMGSFQLVSAVRLRNKADTYLQGLTDFPTKLKLISDSIWTGLGPQFKKPISRLVEKFNKPDNQSNQHQTEFRDDLFEILNREIKNSKIGLLILFPVMVFGAIFVLSNL